MLLDRYLPRRLHRVALRPTGADLAFDATRVARVVAIADARHEASIRVLAAIGRTRAATRHPVFGGEPCREHTDVLPCAAALPTGEPT